MTAVVQNHELGPFTVADWHALPAREDGSRLQLLGGHWLVTPPPSGQHQWAESELISLLKNSLRRAGRTDLYALGGVGIELSTAHRTALIPDFAVLSTRPVGTSFQAQQVVLAGEIWSPSNTFREQQDKHAAYARAEVPFFWSVVQDRGGPIELAAYRLEHGHYVCETMVNVNQGLITISASPVPVDVDVATLRP